MGMQMFNGLPYGGVDPNGIHWSEAKTSVKKNLLPNNAVSQTINGVTFTVNSDGSVTANGTATNTTFRSNIIPNFSTNGKLSLKAGSYIYSICDDSHISGVTMVVKDMNNVDVLRSANLTGATFTLSEDKDVTFDWRIENGTSLSNIKFKAMVRLASILDDTYVPYILDNVELKEEIDNASKSTTLAVDLTNWTQDTTSQSGSTLYKKQISLNHIYVDCPGVDIGCASGSVLPTTAEQEAYNLIQYVTVDNTVPCLYLYASDIPTTAFYINVTGVD